MSEATDLTDWTEQEGGEDPSPEDAVKINLSRWFENHGATVYWEKRPSYGYQIFRTDGGADHPDLLVDGQYRTFAIEVKRGTEGSLIHDGIAQTKRYWSDYIQGTDYRLRSGSVTIDAFLLATEHAPDGRLYYRHGTRDTVRDRHITDRDVFSQFDPPIQWLPDWEFTNTESATRILWRFAKMGLSDEQRDNIDAGVGTMLSDRLDGTQPNQLTPEDTDPFERSPMPAPKALYRSFGEENGIATHNWRWVK